MLDISNPDAGGGAPLATAPDAIAGPARAGSEQVPPPSLGRETLYGVIGAVARGPELSTVLPAVVDLLTEATRCHACFIYLVEGGQLRMRAASSVFADSVGRVSMGLDEGLCGWVVRHDEPAFIRENALADPRMKLVPELEEEAFQSMVAVPLRSGERGPIGVIVLHTEAPREFGQEVLEFLEHVGALVAGAIDNALLYERERTRAQLLEELAALVQRIAGLTDQEELWTLAVDGTRELVGAERARLDVVAGEGGALRVVARSGLPAGLTSGPGSAGAPLARETTVGLDAPPLDAPEQGLLALRLASGGAHIGVLSVERPGRPFTREEHDVVETLAGHLAAALHTLELIARLTEENVVRDLFAAMADGESDRLAGRARAARVDADRPWLIAAFEQLAAEGRWERAASIEEELHRAAPGALCDVDGDSLRVLLPVPRAPSARPEALAATDALLSALADAHAVAAGRSPVRDRLVADPAWLGEAVGAARIAAALHPTGGAAAWDELGAYRYLAHMTDEAPPDARLGAAVERLWAYDESRSAELVKTLEHYLADRRIVPTARALFIHPNTLRQRLDRVQEITGLVVADEDPLSLELAIKVHRLRVARRR